MKLKFDAKRGNVYFFNMRRQYSNVYLSDVLHKTEIGWLMEDDLKVHIDLAEYAPGIVRYNKLANPADLIGTLVKRFPHATIEL